ncbi:hypothetical protein AVEN_150695-1 [Araneus ventricosus]|uniref:Uncharacterized protein n=1 Tax=Araneus ventricosus TaxID=182803 RepID=A0A4Y2LVR1_ARAVE|nr:hypothetical protein AVEN_150695-1 [Araneus ventricosus]
MQTVKPIIHDLSTPCTWRSSTLRHSIFQPFKLGRPFTTAPRNANPLTNSHSYPLPQPSPISLVNHEHQVPPHTGTPYLWPGNPNGMMNIKSGWISNFLLYTYPILSSFSQSHLA